MGLQTGLVAIFKGMTGPDLALLPAMCISVPVNYLLVRYALTSRRFESKKEREARMEHSGHTMSLFPIRVLFCRSLLMYFVLLLVEVDYLI